MKKQLSLTILLFSLVYCCNGQSKTITTKIQYELQANSDSTSNLLILKRRASNLPITLILDDRDTIILAAKVIFKYLQIHHNTFLLNNIPKGDHKIVFLSKKIRKYKNSLNDTFYFKADGNGKTITHKLPKLRFNNAIQIGRGFVCTFYAAIVVLLATLQGAE